VKTFLQLVFRQAQSAASPQFVQLKTPTRLDVVLPLWKLKLTQFSISADS